MSGVELVLFTIFALAGAASALAVVLGRDLFRSTIFFGLFLLVVAGLYFILEAPFVGIMQVFVYVGGVVVMILFGIMLTGRHARLNASVRRGLTAAGAVALFTGILIASAALSTFRTTRGVAEVVPATIGRLFVEDFVLPFELVSVVLLAALIGAIIVAKERES